VLIESTDIHSNNYTMLLLMLVGTRYAYHERTIADSAQDFLPWCLDSRVLRRTPSGFQAELEIGFASVTERYVSNVSLVSPSSIVVINKKHTFYCYGLQF
jgi:hypothetical protein